MLALAHIALIESRRALVMALNAHSGTAVDPEWYVELWRTPSGAPTWEISVVRWEAGREVGEWSLTAAQAEDVLDALAGRGVVGGDAVERVVVAAADAADAAGTVAA